jgi:membrane fusion protein, multidrug efflux system
MAWSAFVRSTSDNIISPSTASGLCVVTQLDPISLIFTLPETVLAQIQ